MPAAAPLAAAASLPPVTVTTRQQGKSTASVTAIFHAAAGVAAPALAPVKVA